MVTAVALSDYMREADLGESSSYRRRMERIEAGKPHVYGGDAVVAGLRCFIRYHKDARRDIELGGRIRSLSRNQVVMHGIVSRIAVTGERETMTAIAREAGVVTSTVGRFLDKLECWGVIAVDRKRGRNGGVIVRMRKVYDGLAAYAERAWSRIKRAASRTRLNVASHLPSTNEGVPRNHVSTTSYMDATFSEYCDGRCTNLLDCSTLDHSPLPSTGTSRAADARAAEAAAFGRAVIAERRLLDAGDPDWDVYLDNVRASYGWQ